MTDRTDDFRLMAAALPPPARVSPPPPKPKLPGGGLSQQVSTLGDFHSAASSIAKNIHVVSQKLERLTKLVQQRGMFNDPASEINSLVHAIKEDMQALNSQLDASQTYVNRRKREMGERNQAANHSVNVVGQLKTELVNTAQTFKKVLQQRSSNLKAQKDHRDRFFSSQSPTLALARPSAYKPLGISPLKPASAPGSTEAYRNGGGRGRGGPGLVSGEGGGGATLPRPGQVTSLPDVELEASADTPLIAPVRGGGQQQSHTQLQLTTGNQEYLESRSSAVQEVEGHIAELGLIFNKLATMLQDQRELVENIHDNVDDAGESVNQGHLALLNTMRSLNSNRRLALSVSGILLLFIIFYVLFLA